MDQIFDRLGNLLKATLRSDSTESTDFNGYSDPDLQDAWDELNDFLKDDTESSTGKTGFEQPVYQTTTLPKEIIDSYAVLGVKPDTPSIDLAKAYKALLLKNHPDRVAGDPSKAAAATEKTKTINRAFQDIKAYRAKTP